MQKMRRWSPGEKAEVARRFGAGETSKSLAAAYGTSLAMVQKFIKLAGAKRLRSDGRSYRRNLSSTEKTQILERYAAGESTVQLAGAFACASNTIDRLLRAAGVARRTNSESHKRCALREDAFDRPLTAESLYWLGFLFADGCVYRREGRGAPALKVALAEKDADHLYKLREFLGSTHKIRHTTVTADRSGKRHATVDLYIRSERLVASLEQLGMGLKSLSRIAPLEASGSCDFWRGVVDGDGHIGIEPTLTLVGGEELLRQFVHFLMQIGIARMPVAKVSHANCWRVYLGGERAVVAMRALYENHAGALTRKAAAASAITSKR